MCRLLTRALVTLSLLQRGSRLSTAAMLAAPGHNVDRPHVDSRGQKVEAGAMPRPFTPHELVSPEMLHLPQPDGSFVSVKRGPITSTLIEVCDAAVGRPPGYDAVGQLSEVETCYSKTIEALLADPNIEIRPTSGPMPVDRQCGARGARGARCGMARCVPHCAALCHHARIDRTRP